MSLNEQIKNRISAVSQDNRKTSMELCNQALTLLAEIKSSTETKIKIPKIIELCLEASKLSPQNLEPYLILIDICLQFHEFEQAEAVLKTAKQINSADFRVIKLSKLLITEKNNYKENKKLPTIKNKLTSKKTVSIFEQLFSIFSTEKPKKNLRKKTKTNKEEDFSMMLNKTSNIMNKNNEWKGEAIV